MNDSSQRLPQGTWKLIAAASIGNALEWFDLAVYGFVAPIIARQFFPGGDPMAGLLLAFGTFGLSYVARPIGAVWLGALADRRGRKVALTWSIALMSVGTAVIVFTPTYQQIGIFASLALVIARLLQGLSAGGEFGAATAMLVEHSPARRGFMGSWQVASQGLSTVLASLFGILLASAGKGGEAAEWVWRMPFLFGLLIAPIGFYIRKHLPDDTRHTSGNEAVASNGLRSLVRTQKRSILLAIALMMGSTSATYVIVYLPTYVQTALHASAFTGYSATLAAGILLTVIPPFVGFFSDRYGRLAAMLPSALVLCVGCVPLFLVLERFPVPSVVLAATVWIALWKAVYFGGLPATLSELFPQEHRATGLNVAYNIGVPLFGGMAPFLLAAMVASNVPAAPGLYLSLMAGVSLLSMMVLKSSIGGTAGAPAGRWA